MEHLTLEAIARLVDEAPTPEETAHLKSCDHCTGQLAQMKAQTDVLGSLPELMPPLEDWRVLEARLRSEGLIETPGLFTRLGLAHTPGWMRAAAAVLLFLTGTGTGVMFAEGRPGGMDDLASLQQDVRFAAATTIEDAATAVRVAEQNYMAAQARFQELMYTEGGLDIGPDPMGRLAALQTLLEVNQAAVRKAPGDPFLNGLLASTRAEHEAPLRLVSRRDNWF